MAPGGSVDPAAIQAFAPANSYNEYADHSRSQPAYYPPSLMLSEDQRPRSRKRSKAPSSSSGATVQSTVFDGNYGDGSYANSISTAPPRNGSVHDRRPDMLLAPLLPCEFSQYTDCQVSFDSVRDVQGWIDHTAAHLNYRYPEYSNCWFCDYTTYGSRSDIQSRFEERMRHIASHIQQGQPGLEWRPDFYMLSHFNQLGLIPEEAYTVATGYHEAPQPRGGINPYPPTSSSSSSRASHWDGPSQYVRAPQKHRKRKDGSIVYKK